MEVEVKVRRPRIVSMYAASKERYHVQAMPWTGAQLFVGVYEELIASRVDVGRAALEEAQRSQYAPSMAKRSGGLWASLL